MLEGCGIFNFFRAVVFAGAFCLLAFSEASALGAPTVAQYDVVWDSPSGDARGSMPLGNGAISLNAWVNPRGELEFYIGRTDSWGDNARLLKVGKVRVELDPAPPTSPFEQRLSLEDATIYVRYGSGPDTVRLTLWVDANHPTVHIEINSEQALTATAIIDLWRTERVTLPSIEASDVLDGDPQERPTIVEPDTVLQDQAARIGWYHRNMKSVGPADHARVQGLTGYEGKDPLLHRTFGAIITSENGERRDDLRIRTPRGTRHQFSVYVDTLHPATTEQWLQLMERHIDDVSSLPLQSRREAHVSWWKDFWNRSWIMAKRNAMQTPDLAGEILPENDYELLVARDQNGGNTFSGEIRNVKIDAEAPGKLLLEAEVRPEAGEKGRIFDKITPGRADGFLLDTEPGNSLRLIYGNEQHIVRGALPAGRWRKLTALADTQAGGWKVALDGETVIDTISRGLLDDAAYLSQMYALQRFITAAQGRGEYPIKFNGGIFNVPHPGAPGDADYRRWGPGYWWQNTRLPYFGMCASGDFEMMRPLFEMYIDRLLPLNQYRTRHYFSHGGAYYPEVIHFWGDVINRSYGWAPVMEEREDPLQQSRWHKWEWTCGLEVAYIALDYYEYTEDEEFLQEKVFPLTQATLDFFDQHYDVDVQGKLIMHPSQACETWWDCTNPMPEVAGLIAVTDRLLALDTRLTTAEQRTVWSAFRAKLPPLPTRETEGLRAFAPAERFAQKQNIENPELYCVFPFRLASFNRPNAELGINALEHRWDRGRSGWRQDDLFMAYLGLADQARENLVARARNADDNMRFPAFWGPNYDWTPDQTHGGVLIKGFQAMLMQAEPVIGSDYDGKIYLMPAWPKEWDVDFKLHAPRNTTVEGRLVDGEIKDLKVRPNSRRENLLVLAPQ